jgi:hypothetical protein
MSGVFARDVADDKAFPAAFVPAAAAFRAAAAFAAAPTGAVRPWTALPAGFALREDFAVVRREVFFVADRDRFERELLDADRRALRDAPLEPEAFLP